MNDLDPHVVPSPRRSLGARAAAAWLCARGVYAAPRQRWSATIAMDDHAARPSSRMCIAIDSQEWGFRFTRGDQMSWIRVIDQPRVQDRDDFGLLADTPALRGLGGLMQALEERFGVRFRRAHARVRTDPASAEDKVRRGVAAL